MYKLKLTKWVINIFNDRNFSTEITALNFGIFNTAPNSGYSLYCTGAKHYSKEDDDWACEENFIPVKKYMRVSNRLNQLQWNAFQDELSKILKEILSNNFDEIPASVEYITCGFDDGNLIAVYTA